jgi:DNA-directed RNA polymerase specialized sigma24 family protein
MSPESSVAGLIKGLKAGEPKAAQQLWDRYCERLVGLARRKLRHVSRKMADEEDVALSAFNSLCVGAAKGRFPAVQDHQGLWGLLVFITAQKAADRIAYENRKKRGAGQVRGESAFVHKSESRAGIDQLLAQEPGPATLNIWAEEYEHLLADLNDPVLRRIAEMSVQRYTVEEISQTLGLAVRTIQRKLNLIRKALRESLMRDSELGRLP